MKKRMLTTLGGLATLSLLVSVLPASATAKSMVDAQMANDLHLKTGVSASLVLGGSSFDKNLIQAGITQYNNDNSKLSVAPFAAYNSTSSGTGRSSVIAGTYNVGFSDFPLNLSSGTYVATSGSGNDTTTPSDYTQIPVALGGVGIIYNLGTLGAAQQAVINKYGLTLNGSVLGQIFAGKITNWQNTTICALNPKLVAAVTVGKKKVMECALPDHAIYVQSRTAGSGTTFMFKDYLSKVDSTDFPSPNSAVFSAASNAANSNSAALDASVAATVGAIGYVEFGYGVLNGNPMANIVNKSGVAVAPNAAGITAAAAAGLASIKTLSYTSVAGFSINNQTGKTVYPIAGFSYAIVKKAQTNEANAIAIAKFLDFLVHSGGATAASSTFGQDLSIGQGYAPLPAAISAQARTAIAAITYNGASVLKTTN